MIFRRFRIMCWIRVTALTASVFAFFYLIYQSQIVALTIVTFLFILAQTVSLIHYVERTNRELNRFLEAVQYEDFSQSFSTLNVGSSFEELKTAFSRVMDKMVQTRSEKEEHYRYLQTVVQHIGIGLISYRQDGEVGLINNAAKRLLQVNQLKNIQSLTGFSKPLVEALFGVRAGDRVLVKASIAGEMQHLTVYATEFILREQKYTLVSIQNIRSELEEKEMEAWQNLIRVLTHEIMNSITPIGSLSSTVNDMIRKILHKSTGLSKPATLSLEDIQSAVETIEKRSNGLIQFVEAYRKLTRIPRPDIQIIPVSELFQRVEKLMSATKTKFKIHLEVDVEPQSLELTADPNLIEQVLINLTKNAIEAVGQKRDGRVRITARIDPQGRTRIQVIDNGPGILEEAQEKIFIPFFTTKKNGSGIGLSLSRQIMRLHRGSISVRSVPEETVFTLQF